MRGQSPVAQGEHGGGVDLVPGHHKGEDGRGHQARGNHGQADAHKGAQAAAAQGHGGFLQVVGDLHEQAGGGQDHKGQGQGDVHQGHAQERIVQPQVDVHDRQRYGQKRCGEHPGHENAQAESFPAPKAEAGEGIPRGRTDEQRDQDGQKRHQNAAQGGLHHSMGLGEVEEALQGKLPGKEGAGPAVQLAAAGEGRQGDQKQRQQGPDGQKQCSAVEKHLGQAAFSALHLHHPQLLFLGAQQHQVAPGDQDREHHQQQSIG